MSRFKTLRGIELERNYHKHKSIFILFFNPLTPRRGKESKGGLQTNIVMHDFSLEISVVPFIRFHTEESSNRSSQHSQNFVIA